MSEYHKIQTVFLRDPATNHKTLLFGQYALPEFAYLANNQWTFTEKVDGTNIRVMWDGARVTFGGKTDNAQIPTPLLDHMIATYTVEAMERACRGPLVLYGEGYGPKIQSGGGYCDSQRLILFDAMTPDGTWLTPFTLNEIAAELGVRLVPVVGTGTLMDAVEMARSGFQSLIASAPLIAEGIVARPLVEMKDRRGHRIITKVKHKDFR